MRSVHTVAVFAALTLVTTVYAGSLHRQSRDTHLCKKLTPETDSIPHASSDPSCKTKYPDYLYQNECTCNFPVAESDANGCTTKYFVRCIKETSLKSAKPQAPEAPLSVSSGVDLSLGNDTTQSNETEASTGAVESPAPAAEHAKSVKSEGAVAANASVEAEVVLPEVTTESTQFILPAAYSPPETAATGNSSAENSTESEEEKAAPAATTSAVSAPSETNVQAAPYGPTEKGASTSVSKESTVKEASASKESQNNEVVLPGVTTESTQFILPAAYSPPETAATGNSSAENSTESEEEKAAPAATTSAVSAPSETNVQAAPYGPTEKGASTSVSKESTVKEASASASKESETAATGNSSAENSTESEEGKAAPAATTSIPSETNVQAAPYGPTEKGASASASKESINNEVKNVTVTEEKEAEPLLSADASINSSSPSANNTEDSVPAEAYVSAAPNGAEASVSPSEDAVSEEPASVTTAENVDAESESPDEASVSAAPYEPSQSADEISVTSEAVTEAGQHNAETQDKAKQTAGAAKSALAALEQEAAEVGGGKTNVSEVVAEPEKSYQAVAPEKSENVQAETAEQVDEIAPAVTAATELLKSENASAEAIEQPEKPAEAPLVTSAAVAPEKPEGAPAEDETESATTAEVEGESDKTEAAPAIAVAVAPAKSESAPAETAAQTATTAAAAEAEEKSEEEIEANSTTAAAVESNKPAEATEEPKELPAKPESVSVEAQVEEKPVSSNSKSSIDVKAQEAKKPSVPEDQRCPVSNQGCIFDDEVEGTDCTVSGNAACRAVGASYCSAVFGSPAQRVCCRIKGVDQPKPNPDIAGCAPSNLGCIFDHDVDGSDCTKGGNSDCQKVGADYCGAEVEGRRVCCAIGNQTKPEFKEDGSETCPAKNGGCIFDHDVNGADCTEGGSKHCASIGSDYCSAKFGSPMKRVCCDISGVAAAPADGDGSKACPVKNSGCIFDHSVSGVDCTTGGDASCKAAGLSYCSAFFGSPSKRVCCDISAVGTAQTDSLVEVSAQSSNVSLSSQEDEQPISINVSAKPY